MSIAYIQQLCVVGTCLKFEIMFNIKLLNIVYRLPSILYSILPIIIVGSKNYCRKIYFNE